VEAKKKVQSHADRSQKLKGKGPSKGSGLGEHGKTRPLPERNHWNKAKKGRVRKRE